MAGGKYRLSVPELAEKRNELMRKANEWWKKVKKLENEAIKIDEYISEYCNHPKKYLKLKRFTDSIPQKTMWLCTLCYQSVDLHPEKKQKQIDKSLKLLNDEILEEMPIPVS